ncbi:MAG TPA: glycosyltransferase [Gemmataceae bacterium]
MTVLHLLPDFNYTAAGRQVGLLAPALGGSVEVHVAGLGPDGPLAGPLAAAGVPVHVLGTMQRFNLVAWRRLRSLVHGLRPDVVHAWRLPAVRAAGIVRFRAPADLTAAPLFRLVVSEPRRGGRLNALDRRLLRSADAVTAGDPGEAGAFREMGVPANRVHQMPPVVVPPPAGPPPLDVPLPPGAKVILCVGALTKPHGFRDAVWAADILRYVVPELRLVIVGDGPERDRLERFALGINPDGGQVHFLPARPDAAALLARADVVWVPSRKDCGRQVLLEALAAGRPVVAAVVPALVAVVEDGRTGLLTPPGDAQELARRTRPLLDDPALAAKLGAAGRAAAAGFAPDRVAPAYAALYAALGERSGG